jgi:hypothetical protein
MTEETNDHRSLPAWREHDKEITAFTNDSPAARADPLARATGVEAPI